MLTCIDATRWISEESHINKGICTKKGEGEGVKCDSVTLEAFSAHHWRPALLQNQALALYVGERREIHLLQIALGDRLLSSPHIFPK